MVEVELWGIKLGLEVTREHGASNVQIEFDSKVAIHLVHSTHHSRDSLVKLISDVYNM